MAKSHQRHDSSRVEKLVSEDESVLPAETVGEATPPEALPVGFKELPEKEQKGTSERAAMEAAVKDGWECRVEEVKEHGKPDHQTEQWVNRRDFKTPGGVVPQGVIRPLEEAYALESQRCG